MLENPKLTMNCFLLKYVECHAHCVFKELTKTTHVPRCIQKAQSFKRIFTEIKEVIVLIFL